MTKQQKLECPRCGRKDLSPELGLNALSRVDNHTYVCSSCGTAEAFEPPMRMPYFKGWVNPPVHRTFIDADELVSVEVQGGLGWVRTRESRSDTWQRPEVVYLRSQSDAFRETLQRTGEAS